MALINLYKFTASLSVLALSATLAVPVSASVLVEPAVRRSGGSTTEVSESDRSTDQNIVDVASSTDSFSTLTAAVQAANIGSILAAEGPYTVFAPTDAAFASLPPGTLDTLLAPANRDLLVKLLYNHVSYGDVTSEQLSAGDFETFDGSVAVEVNPDGVTVDGANVVQADVAASNGVIHAVDQVLLPDGFSEQLQARIGEGVETSASSSSSSTSRITRTTTLQETAIERSTAPAPAAQPVPEPAQAESAAPAQTEPAAQEPVRGLW